MNLTKIFSCLRGAKCALTRRMHVSLFGNVNTQVRCKSSEVKLGRPMAIETNRYRKLEEKIGLYGYSLLASNVTIYYSKILFIL